MYADDIKLSGKKQNISPTWKILMKDVDLGEPATFLDHVYLGCTQRECQTSKDFVDNYRSMFESRIPAGTVENYQKQEPHRNLMPKQYLDGPMTWKVMQRNAWKDIANWRIKQRNNKTKSRHNAWMTIIFKEEIGNKLARAVTKWTKACDKSLARLVSYIHQTCEYRQYCYVGNTAQQFRLGLLEDSDFAGDVEDSKSASGGILCIFGSHTFVPISWMWKKQTSVSHSSTEAEIISLDAGSRMDGTPALTLGIGD